MKETTAPAKPPKGSACRALRCWRFGPCIATVLFAPQVYADNKALGQYLASECTSCHQLSGASAGIPAIVGWPRDQFVAVVKSYRAKERDNEVMRTIASRLTDEEIAALAAYFEGEGKK
jgi:cytochrome c553